MKRKAKPQIEVTCSYCGSKTETFVATPDHLLFCRHQYVGFPPIKDCMTDYYKERKNVRTEQIQEKSKSQKDEKSQEEKKVLRLKNLAKLEAYQKELKLKSWRQRASK